MAMADSLELTTTESIAGAFMATASLQASTTENSFGEDTPTAHGKQNTSLA